MKLPLVITGLFILLVTTFAQATTLKLAPEIDLLVLDGHKISGSLLKGADGLELNHGQHQILFRVEKNLQVDPQMTSQWVSTPLIATFTAQTKSITIALPTLMSIQQGTLFNQHPEFQLYDEHHQLVDNQQDYLIALTDDNYEQAMMVYNMKNNIASVPRFAQPTSSSHFPAAANDLNETRDTNGEEHVSHRILYLWYQQVDTATRQRLRGLLRVLRTS
ncbi:DUF2057 domain-containing protein [Erwinia endophytica]|uniref:YccT family protein n=1 Tax=Erwinia endophytica TaxID=1563158 RepID=UPI001265DFB2|nr:DUF2057 family protein [Erwinia endophytica]KAB8313258.1 DUF2057 domain-containing protein [Erwinia endophytica]